MLAYPNRKEMRVLVCHVYTAKQADVASLFPLSQHVSTLSTTQTTIDDYHDDVP